MAELKPCPFCGAQGFELEHGMVDDPLAYWDGAIRGVSHGYVSCMCGAMVKDYDEDAAIRLWNTRTIRLWNTRNGLEED